MKSDNFSANFLTNKDYAQNTNLTKSLFSSKVGSLSVGAMTKSPMSMFNIMNQSFAATGGKILGGTQFFSSFRPTFGTASRFNRQAIVMSAYAASGYVAGPGEETGLRNDASRVKMSASATVEPENQIGLSPQIQKVSTGVASTNESHFDEEFGQIDGNP